MTAEHNRTEEARAMERIVNATRQVQTACDTAKMVAARLTGKEAPAQSDTEATLDELRARVATVVTYLDGIPAADFAAAAQKVSTPFGPEGPNRAAMS